MSRTKDRESIGSELVPTYAARELSGGVAKHRISDEGMAPRVAYQVIHDELRLDGFSLLNLATFVTTWIPWQLAQDFLEFMISGEFQAIIPTTNWMYPVALPAAQLPADFNQMIDPSPALLFNEKEVASERRQWVV